MGMSSGGDDQGMMAEINVTPFVDVMLVLLIIFMVTTPIIVMDNTLNKIEVDVPPADAVPLEEVEEDHLVISIDDEGRTFLAEQEIPMDRLEQTIKAGGAHPDKQVFECRWGRLFPGGPSHGHMQSAGEGLGMITEPDSDGG